MGNIRRIKEVTDVCGLEPESVADGFYVLRQDNTLNYSALELPRLYNYIIIPLE